MLLIKNGLLYLAQLLLDCITDNEPKVKLIEMRNNENESILDYAKTENIPNVINWIQNAGGMDDEKDEYDDGEMRKTKENKYAKYQGISVVLDGVDETDDTDITHQEHQRYLSTPL